MAELPPTHCLNPACLAINPPGAQQCQACSTPLLVANRYWAVAAMGRASRTWRGQDMKTGRPCLIQRDGSPSAPIPAPLIARLKRVSRHPQLPRLLAAQSRQDGSYLVWQFVEGTPLPEPRTAGAAIATETAAIETAATNTETAATETEIYRLLRSLLPLLGHLHQQGIIHRDIKPQNILKADQRLWLVDFGSAVLVQPGTARQPLPPPGNAEYSAPEQLLGQPTFASDLYSLGLVCVQLLTATPPFELYQQPGGERWQSYLSMPVSAGLRQLLTKLLRPAPQRYRSAAAVLSDLQALPGSQALSDSQGTPKPASRPAPRAWRCTHILTGHRGKVTALTVSDTQVISGGSDRTIQLWTWQGERTQMLQRSWFEAGHRDRINGLQIEPGGDSLASSSADGTLCRWSLIDYQWQRHLVSPGWGVEAFVATADLWISGGESGILLWDSAGAVIERWRQRQVTGLAISPNQQILLSSSRDGTVRFWELSTARVLGQLEVGVPVTAMAPLPGWAVLALGDERGQLHLWDIVQMRRLRTIAAHQGPVTALSCAPQGLASGGDDSQIHLWQVPAPEGRLEAQLLQRPQELARTATLSHDWSIRAIAFSPSGDRLASGSADETLRLWQR